MSRDKSKSVKAILAVCTEVMGQFCSQPPCNSGGLGLKYTHDYITSGEDPQTCGQGAATLSPLLPPPKKKDKDKDPRGINDNI